MVLDATRIYPKVLFAYGSGVMESTVALMIDDRERRAWRSVREFSFSNQRP